MSEAAERVTRFLDTYATMSNADPEEIIGVGSAASNHETVMLLVSDLRALVAPTEATETVAPARPQTDDEAYVYAARRHYDTVATRLEQVAADIRQRGQYVGSGKRSAVAHAADAMSEFTQGVGGIGSFLWGIVHDAEHLDRFRREGELPVKPAESGASGTSGVTR